MRPYSGAPPRPKTRGGRRPSIASLARSRISARISSSYGGGSGSSRTPAARAARSRVAASRGVAASGSHADSSIVVVNAAPEDPMSQSYSAPVASASAYGNVVSWPSPNRRGPTSLGCGAWSGGHLGKSVLQDRAGLQRDPLARVHARGHSRRIGRAPTPTSPRVLSREEPADRRLRAVVVDRAGRVDSAEHEEDIGLIEERERELPPEIARRGVRRIAAALDAV